MRLSDPANVADSVMMAVAELARAYAGAIDEATHVPLGLATALDKLAIAAQLADESAVKPTDEYTQAHRKVAAALSTVTVLTALGPKLLDTYKTLAPARATPAEATAPTSPLGALRAEEDELTRRRARHAG